jgi:alpha-tubulin suppressor-like RCC1 family protein
MTTHIVRLAAIAGCLATGAVEALADSAASVAAGHAHTCAVTTGTAVTCWGDNTYGQLGDGTTTRRSTPTLVSGLGSGVTAIAAGDSHTCALTVAGGVLCWGLNGDGQLGDGTTTNRLVPAAVSGLASGVAALAAGGAHTCALTTSGGMVCWGSNASGQLGNGTTMSRSTPIAVTGLGTGIAAITAGYSHTCAMSTGGGMGCWGNNLNGQLGDGTTTQRLTPTAVSGLGVSGVAAISAGNSHTCALTTGAGALCWGTNYTGQLGDGTTTQRLTPTAVSGLGSGVTAIAAGDTHTCALKAGAGATCWGDNGSGRLGDGTTTSRLTPTAVSGLGSGVAAINGGGSHTCSLMTGGPIRCWGSNGEGQLGDGTTQVRVTPTAVSGLGSGVAAIVTGDAHTCALTAAGGVLCWGDNGSGRLGDGTATDRSTPTAVSGLQSGVAAIAAGQYHTCALTTGGGVLCWGSNASGQLGDGTTTSRATPTAVSGLGSGVAAVSAGGFHTCALTAGGGVLCWGSNATGQLGDGTTTQRLTPAAVTGLGSGIAAIAAGYNHTCARSTGGGMGCWGNNLYGNLGDGTTTTRLWPVAVSGLGTSGVAAISVGVWHSCALTTGGGVLCWGANFWGQLGDGTTTQHTTPTAVSGLGSGVSKVAAGGNHTCAVTAGGGASCWGWNSDGQLGDGTTTYRTAPVAVIGLGSGTAEIDPGLHDTCAVTGGGGARCWGSDGDGQLGTGARLFVTIPLAVYGYGGTISVNAITPAHGSPDGGTAVAITGAYFLQGADVSIGGTAATEVTVLNTGEILATTGAHAAATADVVVHNPDGTEAMLPGAFRYGTTSASGSDFTGDRKSDILWHHATRGEVWLWPMSGGQHTAESYVSVVADTGWAIRGLGDQTGDGQADLLWRHATSGQLYLWTMNGSAVEAETYLGTVDPAFDIVGTGDYNGDGRSDILWRHATTGELWLWLLNGAATLSVTYVDTVDLAYEVKGSGDLNADGKDDLVWQHTTTGEVWVWLMNGTVATQVAYVATVGELDYRIVGVADYTGDGKADLLWHHATRGEIWLWQMNGAAAAGEAYVGTVPDTHYRIVGTGDYDGDGKADILWHHATRGEVWVWLMNGPVKLSETHVATVPDTGYRIIR